MPTRRLALWAVILILAALALFSYADPSVATAITGPSQPPFGTPVDDQFPAKTCDQSGVARDKDTSLAQSEFGLSAAELVSLPTGTDPSIAISLPPWNPAATAPASIAGHTTPDTPVQMRMLRGDVQVGLGRTVSDLEGYYLLNAGGRSDCRPSVFDWRLLPGDTVEVTAGGRTTSTRVAAPIIARLDAWEDRLSGETMPGEEVELTLYQPTADLCAPTVFKRTVTAGIDGTFAQGFGDAADVKNDAWATACIPDAGGNGVCWTAYASRLETWLGSEYVSGYVPPGRDYQLRLFRNGVELGSNVIRGSNPTGRFTGYASRSLMVGDRLEVDLGTHKLVAPLVELNAEIDVEANRLTGNTAPGQSLRATAYQASMHATSFPTVLSTCDVKSRCISGAADLNGQFDLALPFDAQPGANASLEAFDDQGNFQRRDFTTAAIIAFPADGVVHVEWPALGLQAPGTPRFSRLFLYLYGPQNNLKRQDEAQVDLTSWNDAVFWMNGLQVGDRLVAQAIEGTAPVTMTVHQVKATLDRSSNTLSGEAEAGRLMAMPYRKALVGLRGLPAVATRQRLSACTETSFEGGAFRRVYPPMGLSGADYAYVFLQGDDGHYSAAMAAAFEVSTEFDSLSRGTVNVYGAVGTSRTKVHLSTVLGGVASSRMMAPFSPGFFNFSLPFSGPLRSGDKVEVSSENGYHYFLDVGALVPPHAAGSGRLLCGKMPGAGTVIMGLEEQLYPPALGRVEGIAYSDADGEYCVDLARTGVPVSSADTSLCLPLRVGSPCASSTVEFAGIDGHSVSFATSYDSSPDPDPFEADNDYASASVYTGPQHRTLTRGDSDWVRFTVPPGLPGSLTLISVGNMGMGADVIVSLYGSGQVLLDNWHEPNPTGEELVWRKALAPGTYTLNINRPDPFASSHCAFTYDLLIAPANSVFLPVLRR